MKISLLMKCFYNNLYIYLHHKLIRRISSLLIIQFVFTLSSCEYRPEGEFFTEIDQPKPPNEIVIDIGNNSDTLNIIGWPRIPFKVIIDGYEFNKLIINLEEYQLYNNLLRGTWDSISGVIDFLDNNISLSDGLYDLSIEIFIYTGASSLGNVHETEFFIIDTVKTLTYKQFE
jgi:hypothetical protein